MFEATIVSPQFAKKATLARHRLVNNTLKEEIAAIHAWTPKNGRRKKVGLEELEFEDSDIVLGDFWNVCRVLSAVHSLERTAQRTTCRHVLYPSSPSSQHSPVLDGVYSRYVGTEVGLKYMLRYTNLTK